MSDDFRRVLISTIILKLYNTAIERVKRHSPITPVYIAIDEFQDIMDMNMVSSILSDAKKFGVYFQILHHSTNQLSDDILNTIVGNVDVIVRDTSRVPRIRDAVRSENDVIKFMKDEMNDRYGAGFQ